MPNDLIPREIPRSTSFFDGRWEQVPLFLALMLLCVAHPLLVEWHTNPHVIELAVALVFLAALWPAPRFLRRLIAVYAVLRLVGYVGPASVASAVGASADFATVLVLGILFGLAVHSALLETSFAMNRLCGALNGYLLLGTVFAKVLLLLHAADPSCLQASGELADRLQNPMLRQDVVIYFSFVTLTTVGYGDIVPTSTAARTLAWMEAMLAQFYLAVVVAGLVGSVAGLTARASRLELPLLGKQETKQAGEGNPPPA